jgi:hypothetical protein
MIDSLIKTLVNDPTEQNVKEFLNFIDVISYSLLEDAQTYPYKSQEYFSKRKEAFSVKPEAHRKFINAWVTKHKSTENFPLPYKTSPYELTLNIPFQEIRKPKDE